MEALSSGWLRFAAQRGWELLGISGIAGLVLALVAFVVQWAWIEPMAGTSTQARAIDWIVTAKRAGATTTEPADPRTELDAFYAYLGTEASVEDQLAAIYTAAQAAGIRYARAEYRSIEVRGARLSEYAIVVPVRGTYPQIRHFVRQALAAVPAVALDGVSLQRKRVSDAQLDGEVRLTVFRVEHP